MRRRKRAQECRTPCTAGDPGVEDEQHVGPQAPPPVDPSARLPEQTAPGPAGQDMTANLRVANDPASLRIPHAAQGESVRACMHDASGDCRAPSLPLRQPHSAQSPDLAPGQRDVPSLAQDEDRRDSLVVYTWNIESESSLDDFTKDIADWDILLVQEVGEVSKREGTWWSRRRAHRSIYRTRSF